MITLHPILDQLKGADPIKTGVMPANKHLTELLTLNEGEFSAIFLKQIKPLQIWKLPCRFPSNKERGLHRIECAGPHFFPAL